MRIKFFLCAGLAFFGAQCTRNKSSTPTNDSIDVGWDASPRSIDPRYITDANGQYLEDLVNCSLIDFDVDGKAIGDLATSWTWTSPSTLTFNLKPAKFSDGTSVTAHDVKATYDYFLKKFDKDPPARAGAFKVIKEIKVQDPQNLTFELTNPDTTFVTNLIVGILPSANAGSPMMDSPGQLTGCGPFKLASVDIQKISLIPNTSYSLGSPPKNSVNFEIVKDETTRLAKLVKGEIDIIQNSISRDKVAEIEKRQPGLKVVRRPGINVSYIGFNMKDPNLSKLAVREAMAHAIDRTEIIKFVLKDLAIPANSMLPPSDPFYKKSNGYDYDPKKAMAILDKAGFKDPDGDGPKPRLTLEHKTSTDLTALTVVKALAAQLARVGIAVKVQPLEWGKFKSDVDKGNIQMWTLSWIGFKDPDIFRYAFATESFAPDGANRGRYSNKDLDKLLDEGRRTTSQADRQKIYSQVQDIVAKDLPYIFLWHQENFAVVNKNVQNFTIYADGRYTSLKDASRQ